MRFALAMADKGQGPILSMFGDFDDRDTVEVVKKSLIDRGRIGNMPPDEALFTEEFLPQRP